MKILTWLCRWGGGGIIDKLLASFVAISHLKIVCEEGYSPSASLVYPFLPRLDLTGTQS